MRRPRLSVLIATTACCVSAAADRDERPIRGAWLRPPTSLAILEAHIEKLADAGIQDLYLETFYHGLATNDSQVFRDRFTFDYLAEAIRIGARRSVRVHCWLESAYWSYSGSGSYVLSRHPEWKVVDINGNTDIGDQPGQTFVNLGHPGVQQMLAEYCAELAQYAGLEGIQTDYHRFPLDNDTGDQYAAPYSFDDHSRAAFAAVSGVDPLLAGATPDDPFWDEWVRWRRDSISLAADRMHQAIESVNPGVVFSGAVFAAATTSGQQLVKMQDWPTWAANGYIDHVVPMAYGTSTNSIRSDLQLAMSLASGRRVVAGLAILNNQPRPSISQQLGVARQVGIEDFIFFEATVITADPARQAELAAWIGANATAQVADFDRNGYIDARDRTLLGQVWSGGDPVGVTPRNRQFDLDDDGWIDGADLILFESRFDLFRFGEDGVVDQRDLQALLNVWTGPGGGDPLPVLNLYDLDGDGDVDYDDQLRLHASLTVDLPPDTDVNRDGKTDIDDLYAQTQDPIDVDRDGTVDPATDTRRLESELRDGEIEDMTAGRRGP
jgi:uncharacterized lipoprotein YddW (UPF0748 family)